jgi:hypothetical protein
MKSTTRSKTCVTMASLILATALAIPAASQKQVPFKGSFQGKDAVNPPTITTSGAGYGTHIGNFSLTEETSLTSAPPAGSARWVAANGDSIDSTFIVVSFQPNTPDGYATITESHTVNGGTGRFAGAQGSFTLERLHVLAPNADGTHEIFGSFQGSITPPGATH